ncbi:MAG TPA: UpxY family transcription antiterminator [Verrucomicrobiae bacterium]|nr:UpxY family transcription antiterminator [Verrucomicrobiae bacterium]
MLTMPAGPTPYAPHWYAIYTCPRHEKRVAEHLAGRAVEFFLPQYETVSRRKDRRVRLSLPLFPGYLFVRILLEERLRVLEAPGVVRLVGSNGHPAELPEEDLEKLRNGLSGSLRAEPHPFLAAGRRVQIVRGPLEGLAGILLRRKGQFRVVLSLDLIQRSICVDVDVADVVPAFHPGRN